MVFILLQPVTACLSSIILQCCYNKCVKRFFGYNKYDSATASLVELKLPIANTVLRNHRFLFKACWKNHSNSIVSLIRDVYRPTPLF